MIPCIAMNPIEFLNGLNYLYPSPVDKLTIIIIYVVTLHYNCHIAKFTIQLIDVSKCFMECRKHLENNTILHGSNYFVNVNVSTHKAYRISTHLLTGL